MKILHIEKTEPDETVDQLKLAFENDEVETIALHQEEVDWAELIDRIFAADKVISWW